MKWYIHKCPDCGKWHAVHGLLIAPKIVYCLKEITADTWDKICLEIAVESAFERVN